MCCIRFGHSSVKIEDSAILCIGGFGIDYTKVHKRLDEVLLIRKISGQWHVETICTTGLGPGKNNNTQYM